jgi:hypothetical protein
MSQFSAVRTYVLTDKSTPYIAYHYTIKYITDNKELFTLTYE